MTRTREHRQPEVRLNDEEQAALEAYLHERGAEYTETVRLVLRKITGLPSVLDLGLSLDQAIAGDRELLLQVIESGDRERIEEILAALTRKKKR